MASEGTDASDESNSVVDLAKSISALFEKLGPWKATMPDELRAELEKVELEAGRHVDNNFNECIEDIPQWTCEVEIHTMDDWKRGIRGPREDEPTPVIQAYYQKLNLTRSDRRVSQDALNHVGDQKNLQRIQINSDILHTELENLTSTSTVFPIIITSPYKILLEFLPRFESRLAELRLESERTSLASGEATPRSTEPTAATDGEIPPTQEQITTPTKVNPPQLEDLVSMEPSPEPSLEADETDSIPRSATPNLLERIAHLQCLVNFIHDNLKGLIEMRAQITNGTLKSIAFDDLWHLFRPGDLVVTSEHGRERLNRVFFVTGGLIQRKRKRMNDERRPQYHGLGTWTSFRIYTYQMEFDGNEVGMTVDIIGIEHYLGKKPIFDLKVYPVQLHAKEDNIVQRMEDRGRRFMASMGHQYYEGLTLPHLNLDIDDDRKEKYIKLFERREDLASEVFVDFEAYYQVFHPFKPGFTSLPAVPQDPFEGLEETSTPNEVLRHSGQEVDLKIAEDYMAQNRDLLRSYYPGQSEANSEHYRLLSHGVPGYSFRHRKWYLLDVDNLRPIDHNSHPGFEYLVIPQEYKDLLLALVDNHTSGIQRRREKVNSQARALDNGKVDIVPGKGQGLIVLLHGPPGSGKTSTAETIAAYTRRPLYSITCGDIGLDPESVETQLRAHTRRADKWGCVLLLDEADVFLVSRTHRELKRNALVSVFLRQLEYYSGILFLTTNRPGTLDEAFKSRIHVSLRYPGMDLESTKLLWNNMMKLLTADNAFADVKVEFDRARLIAFAEKHYKRCQQEGRAWNGRQIRNAFQTALALAHAERVAKIRDDGDTLGETAASSKKKPATVRLAAKHFRTIAKTTEAFEDYIVWLRGKDSDVAREAEVRDDDYDPDLPQARKSYGIRMGGKRSSTFELSAQHHGEQSLSGYAQKRRTRHPKLDSEDDESEEEEQGESDSDGSI